MRPPLKGATSRGGSVSAVSPRLSVELTSDRSDGTWTWRAAGARQPKGVLDGALLSPGAKVGDVVRAEADIDIEGITITSVLATKGERQEPERLKVLGSGKEEPAVTSNLSGKPERRGPSDRPDRPRRDRPERSGPGRPRGEPGGATGPRDRPESSGPRPERRPRPPRPEVPARPKPKKLRPGRVHRDALLATLPPEQEVIAAQALRGGMPAVRSALEEQRSTARAEGRPEIPVAAVLAIAEGLLPRLRVAEWLDRADAALVIAEELSLADLRSVVVSADDVARDEQTRELAATLRVVLERRSTEEAALWRRDLEQSLAGGRVVRALRLSSRSPQPGERLDPEMAASLAKAAGEAMTSEVTPDRWAVLLDAVAYSGVRRTVTPAGVPAEPGEELLAQVHKHAGRVPAIAALFGVEASAAKPRRASGRRPGDPARRPKPSGTPSDAEGPPSGRPRRIPPPPVAPAEPSAASSPAAPEAAEPPGTEESSPSPEAPTVGVEPVVEASPPPEHAPPASDEPVAGPSGP